MRMNECNIISAISSISSVQNHQCKIISATSSVHMQPRQNLNVYPVVVQMQQDGFGVEVRQQIEIRLKINRVSP